MDERKALRRAAAQRRRTHNVILAGIFLLLLIVFALINLIVKDREFSDTENRNLAQKPSFSMASLADGTYFAGLTDHFNDQFFARDGWISMKLKADTAMGKKEAGGVFLCEEGYLMGNPDAPNDENVAKNIEAINAFAQQHRDISCRMMMAPTSASILTQYLPKNAPVENQLEDMEVYRQGLDPAVQYIDVAAILQKHSEEYIYYKTDHHWTSLGAYYVFAESAGVLGIGNPVTDYTTYTLTESFQGTLASKSGSYSSMDSIDIYVPSSDVQFYVSYPDTQEKVCSLYRSECLENKDQYTVFFGGNHPILEIRTTANNDRSLLVFKDSYANCFMQFLTPYYENIVMVDPRYYYDSLDSVLNSYGITDVLYLFCADTLLTDGALSDVLATTMPDDTAETAGTPAEEGFGTASEAAGTAETSAEEPSAPAVSFNFDTDRITIYNLSAETVTPVDITDADVIGGITGAADFTQWVMLEPGDPNNTASAPTYGIDFNNGVCIWLLGDQLIGVGTELNVGEEGVSLTGEEIYQVNTEFAQKLRELVS